MIVDDERYVLISSDCHAGAPLDVYRGYLDSSYLDEFDEWAEQFANPFGDLADTSSRDYLRNFDHQVRQEDLEGDGIVGEVIFPNTIPPFYAGHPLFSAPDPTSERDLELRWVGVRAHNRWLADFCAELPGRRAGVAQILLDDIDRALEEVRWVSASGLFGGILLPNPAPHSSVPPVHAPDYEPLWSLCEELGVVVNNHGGGGLPNLGPYPATGMIMFVEIGWYGLRPLTRLLLSGVLERHPGLIVAFTETGNSWIPDELAHIDSFHRMARDAKEGSVESFFGAYVRESVPLRPSEYWARQCFLGASFMSPRDCANRERMGVDRVMWGADYPHTEGTHPHTDAALRHTFAGVPRDETRAMLGSNAARAYGFDLDQLQLLANEIGPLARVLERGIGRDELPAESVSIAMSD
jgi:predicted TIM-barrel fold metal-dependent hydrolase